MTTQTQTIPPLFSVSTQSQTTSPPDEMSRCEATTSQSQAIPPLFPASCQFQTTTPLPSQSNKGISLDGASTNEMDISAHLNSNEPSSAELSTAVEQPSADIVYE